ncbi:ribulokinase [Chondrinema litorale]|uniref:ribulokinase n=1 Tax=Chondrinema litorale TaxID=2994555 RepID=UPI0025431A23|nr:ribulokinase [Chondrinema litorale]UZR98794.1 ribulokinase [Chondrinema litorale]
MKQTKYVIGMDFGTDSVRSVLINAADGSELASATSEYKMWKEGKYCIPSKNQFRQHPLDYIESMKETIKGVLSDVSEDIRENVVGMAVDTTGSTIIAVNEEGTPLAMTPEFKENPNAMFILWKDHTATKEAKEINELAKTWGGEDYTKYEGGIYSSEWFWAKILRTIRVDDEVKSNAYSWLEHCDWIPAILTGETDPKTLKRSRCAAGHKAMWHKDFGGLPPEEFFVKLDPLLAGTRDRLFMDETYTSDEVVGTLTPEWAKELGLPESVKVSVGAFDSHMGAVGGAVSDYTLCRVIGTSTCDILVAPTEEVKDILVSGICGQVDGSVIPGMEGMEAGQSAFGDIYAWFKNVLAWPIKNIISESTLLDEATKEKLIKEATDGILPKLTAEAEKIPLETSLPVAIDWMNGRRTPDANQLLKGAITGLNLGSDAPRIFRSLVEATAFGSRAIVDRFQEQGVNIKKIIALGGIPQKSPFVMQILADVLNRNIIVASSLQTCALGASIFAATAAGVYDSVAEAQKVMQSGFDKEYEPIPENVDKYKVLYAKYKEIGKFLEEKIHTD